MEDETKIAMNEIGPDLFDLMMDVFGNYVVQKLFEVCDQSQKQEIGNKMEGNVFRLSMEMYGCRVSLTLLEDTDERWSKKHLSMFRKIREIDSLGN